MGERIFQGRICNKRKCEGTLRMVDRAVRGEEQEQEKKKRRRDLEGIAILAWLPSGSVSGHFIHPASSTCLGLFGTGKDGFLPACPPICCIIIIIISRTKFTENQTVGAWVSFLFLLFLGRLGFSDGWLAFDSDSTIPQSLVAEIPCERECSRGEDHRLLNFTILDFTVCFLSDCFFPPCFSPSLPSFRLAAGFSGVSTLEGRLVHLALLAFPLVVLSLSLSLSLCSCFPLGSLFLDREE